MKKRITKSILMSLISICSFAQLKVINNGYVAVGINYPIYPFHVYGWGQLFNDNGMEIKFRPNNGGESDIGSSNSGILNFWNANCWASGGWNKLKANKYYTVSDQRLKKEISPLQNGLSIIKQFHPKQYLFLDSIQTAESHRKNYGFLAQDVIQFLPDLVDTTRNAYALDYIGIIPFLVGAVKEQSEVIDSLKNVLSNNNQARKQNGDTNNRNSDIDSLKNEVSKMRAELNNCCSKNQENQAQNLNSLTNLTQSNNDVLLLNIPNPFDNSTIIKFSVPAKYTGKCYIKIYTINGAEKMSYNVNLTEKELIITSEHLASGLYLYALVVGDEILSIKQMVVSK